MADTATLPSITERVARGVAWLDQQDSGWNDWWQRVDLDQLEMSSECRCILGQLCGTYYQAPISPVEATWCGFDCSTDSEDEEEQDAEFDALTAEWARVITERRAAVAP